VLKIFFSDGVIEATNPEGEEWGVEGLLNAMVTRETQCLMSAEEIVQSIFDSMDDFSRGCQTDDATLAALRV
jgi:serine phosphatase RsbU (regulator of sigma subunit)